MPQSLFLPVQLLKAPAPPGGVARVSPPWTAWRCCSLLTRPRRARTRCLAPCVRRSSASATTRTSTPRRPPWWRRRSRCPPSHACTRWRAKEYPFTLDPCQETAIACLVRAPPLSRPLRRSRSRPELTERLTRLLLQERRESVLVAAHTSAGKTVVAECVRLVMRVRNRKHQRHRQRSLVLLRVACAVTVLRAHAACICALSPQVRHRHGAARQAEGHLYFAAQGTLRQSQQFCVVVSDCLLPLPRRRCPTRSTAS